MRRKPGGRSALGPGPPVTHGGRLDLTLAGGRSHPQAPLLTEEEPRAQRVPVICRLPPGNGRAGSHPAPGRSDSSFGHCRQCCPIALSRQPSRPALSSGALQPKYTSRSLLPNRTFFGQGSVPNSGPPTPVLNMSSRWTRATARRFGWQDVPDSRGSSQLLPGVGEQGWCHPHSTR